MRDATPLSLKNGALRPLLLLSTRTTSSGVRIRTSATGIGVTIAGALSTRREASGAHIIPAFSLEMNVSTQIYALEENISLASSEYELNRPWSLTHCWWIWSLTAFRCGLFEVALRCL